MKWPRYWKPNLILLKENQKFTVVEKDNNLKFLLKNKFHEKNCNF